MTGLSDVNRRARLSLRKPLTDCYGSLIAYELDEASAERAISFLGSQAE